MPELSHATGDTDQPLIEQTIGAIFDAVTERQPGTMALISRHQNVRLTYAELRNKVDALACGFHRLGLRKGDRVGIWAPNCMEWTLTQYATAKLGLILVNVNPAYRLSEIEYALNKVGCRALVTAPKFKSSSYIEMLETLMPDRAPTLEFAIRLGQQTSPGFLNFDDLLNAPKPDELETLQTIGATLNANDAINIQFTSGTTGTPKGATLTHRNILNNGHFVVEAIGLKTGETLCVPVPLYHCFGMVMGNLGCLTHGATIVYPGEAFDPAAVLDALDAEACVGIYAVPTMFIAMLEHESLKGRDLSNLRTGIMAGSPCPVEIMRRVIGELGCKGVTIAYGMTETAPVSFQSALDDPIERRVSTVGRIQPHAEVKLVDETGKTVPRGTPGELCTRGYLVMQGYWGDEDTTRAAIDAEGFLHTGDLAVMDDDGYATISGRLKDMVIRGGENIYPREVEEFLYQHPKILDVQVIGLPSATYGEELCACVIAKEHVSEDELRDFCKDQIAHFKIPRYVMIMEDFPMTVTGKVQKFVLRDELTEKLGLSKDVT
ncbi:AMP-binding protein [Rhodobacteraceae bacterium]|nr:AMP-binding protein [Paracoccaceae bacterium]